MSLCLEIQEFWPVLCLHYGRPSVGILPEIWINNVCKILHIIIHSLRTQAFARTFFRSAITYWYRGSHGFVVSMIGRFECSCAVENQLDESITLFWAARCVINMANWRSYIRQMGSFSLYQRGNGLFECSQFRIFCPITGLRHDEEHSRFPLFNP